MVAASSRADEVGGEFGHLCPNQSLSAGDSGPGLLSLRQIGFGRLAATEVAATDRRLSPCFMRRLSNSTPSDSRENMHPADKKKRSV